MLDLKHINENMILTAQKAGAFIRNERRAFKQSSVQQKGLNDLVSYVDQQSEKMIVDDLQKILPGAGFIVEENTKTERGDYNWIVDPLDGTTNFIHGIPSYAVSIALEHKGKILSGVVLEVSAGECFSAYSGSGAFLNGLKIKVSDAEKLKDSLIATGFPVQEFSRIDPFLKCLAHFLRNTHGVRRIGAAAVDLCYLACGRFEGFFEYNLKAWDVAAGALIVQEAGGTLADFSGGDNWLFGKEMLCSNSKIHNEFLDVIKREFGV